MGDIAIKVENLGKCYQIGQAKSGDIRESFNNRLNKLKNRNKATEKENEFWALKDINFEIRKGEAVGIIGRNGAGKSTLLKILSRITQPTRGRFEINGRVSSLLEVGTGFHPELSGRENIYLNGTILGMKRYEIRAKFDEIIAFSGVEKFIDTPVKHYSSGMKVRLAFSVAAFLEPEVLIIDEVLAVGDSVFQAKCIDKMTEVAKSGKTILFVSHNMSSVKNLCNRGILISAGRVVEDGSVDKIISDYLYYDSRRGTDIDLLGVKRDKYAGNLIFEKVSFGSNPVSFGEGIIIKLRLKNVEGVYHTDLDIGISIKDKNGNVIIHISNRFIHSFFDHEHDEKEYIFKIQNSLKIGNYIITLFLRVRDEIQDWLRDVVRLEVIGDNPYGFNDVEQIQGVILPSFSIEIK